MAVDGLCDVGDVDTVAESGRNPVSKDQIDDSA